MNSPMMDQVNDFLQSTGITIPPVGVYDVEDPEPFAPFSKPGFCIFNDFNAWSNGKSTMVSKENAAAFGCPGAGYWLCGLEGAPRKSMAGYLAGQEGLKASPKLMEKWLENHPPYTMENRAIVISRVTSRAGRDHYDHLKTVTFFVGPDHLSLLLTGAEYLNARRSQPVKAVYGSGCGQMLCLFDDIDTPAAMVGATDIAMRKHLPAHIMAFTVTKPMLEQICQLDGDSFLHKTFWSELKNARSAS